MQSNMAVSVLDVAYCSFFTMSASRLRAQHWGSPLLFLFHLAVLVLDLDFKLHEWIGLLFLPRKQLAET